MSEMRESGRSWPVRVKMPWRVMMRFVVIVYVEVSHLIHGMTNRGIERTKTDSQMVGNAQ